MSGEQQRPVADLDEKVKSAKIEKEELWLDRSVRYFGLGQLAKRVPGDLSPSYLYAIVTIVLSNIFTISYNIINGVPLIYSTNPYFALQPIILLGAVYGAHSLHNEYYEALIDMRIDKRATNPKSLFNPVPSWLPWALFAVGAGLQLTRATLDMAGWGVTDFFANFFLFPFVFLPIIVQFFIIYMTIEFFGPRQLSKSDVRVHFLDPQGVGGLRPIGELVKKAYYYIGAGLIGYSLITYAPFVDSSWTVSAAAGTIFTIVWIVTVASIAFAVLTLHRFLAQAKRKEIQRLEKQLRDCIQNPWDVKSYEIPESKQEEVDDLRERISRVNETNEYPATFSIWSQILLSIILPKAIQLTLASV